jgi:hypothetical protein
VAGRGKPFAKFEIEVTGAAGGASPAPTGTTSVEGCRDGVPAAAGSAHTSAGGGAATTYGLFVAKDGDGVDAGGAAGWEVGGEEGGGEEGQGGGGEGDGVGGVDAEEQGGD